MRQTVAFLHGTAPLRGGLAIAQGARYGTGVGRLAGIGRGGGLLALLVLPGCAGSIIFGLWLACMAGLASLVWLTHRIRLHFERQDRDVLLGAVARQLGLSLGPHPHGLRSLQWRGRRGLRIEAHASAHLELRIALPNWLPQTLVIDTIAPPVRGLGRWVPDPRLTDWVASGPQAELLGLMAPQIRDLVIEAHTRGPGPGICIRRGALETSLAWADSDAIGQVVARLECLAEHIHNLPTELVQRLFRSATSDSCAEVRQASLHVMKRSFAQHALTHEAQHRAGAVHGAGLRDERGRLALVAKHSAGQVSVMPMDSVQGEAGPKSKRSASLDPISAS